MVKQKGIFLAGVLILILVLVAPVSANKYVVTSSSIAPAAGADVTVSAQLSQDDGTAIATAGKVVTWSKTGSGGSFLALTSTTNAAGIATMTFTTGIVAGTAYAVTGTDTDTFTGTSVAITTVAGTPTQIAFNTGNGQSALVGTAVAIPPSVIVKDANNNPVNGRVVIFSADPASATVSGGTQTTNPNGIATVGSWTLGSIPLTNTLTATCGSLSTSITATGTAPTAPTITGISPNSGYNTSTISSVQITGTGFSTTGAVVNLTKSGETNIPGACSVGSATSIYCSFPITGKPAGSWNVLVLNADGQTATLTSGFTINSPTSSPTLTSIAPASGVTNTTVTITSLVGTNFGSAAGIRLRRSSYNDIIGAVSSVNADHTVIAGSFNLNNQAPGSYQVCVFNDASIYVCGLTFTITSPYDTSTNSSVYFESNPSGATIYLNGTNVGTTVLTYYNATPGTHKVLLQKSGYRDYSGYVTVITGRRVSFYASLAPISADTTAVTPVVTAYTTPVKTTTTIKKSTLKVPTTWASTPTATESPVDPVLIIGAVGLGLGLVVIRRR